ncbi:MAG: histidinol dehydrogenase, partial [Devosiaceae bacterium]|nr:histidinol dehydrogenase [Devosiaceae bacterium]
AAARIAGVDEIYRIGGAQAIGALAYGTHTIQPVFKIVGPGNAYVAEAKRQVFGTVGIDMIAGPSEIMVIADASANPAWVAADLLAQAEHGAGAKSIAVVLSEEMANAVEAEVERQLETLGRNQIARQGWDRLGAIIIVPHMGKALELANEMAPEHLELAVDNPEELLPLVRNAGAVFMGHHTPEAIGDYVGGSNHVLPTAQTAKFASGLGTIDFMKRTSLLNCSPGALAQLGAATVTLAEAEDLQAHGRSVSIRLNR